LRSLKIHEGPIPFTRSKLKLEKAGNNRFAADNLASLKEDSLSRAFGQAAPVQ
jgi:hypothetical protein